MTEWERVTVNDPRGPVNNGTGAQYVYYGAAPDWAARKRVEALRIAREDRIRLADRFVPPLGYRTAADRLEKPGSVVLLDGRPGSGRRAAAIMLLHGLGEDGGVDEQDVRFEELPYVEDKREPSLAPGEGDRFLLDLSGITDAETYVKAQHRLAVRRSQVREAGAHLAVVLPADLEHAHVPDFEPDTVRLGRPRGLAVLTRHLRMDRLPFRTPDLGGPEIRALCERSPMRELARFARLVRTAHDDGRFGTDFADWLGQAMRAVTDRAGEVRAQVRAVGTAADRALLLTAAMFEELHADSVYEAWHCLMRTVKHEEEATTELGRRDFGERLKTLGIARDADGRLRFKRLAYAEAVRAYFWENFPGVRDDLRDWIGDAAGDRRLTTDDRVNVVVRFAERSLAAGRPDDLFVLVARWANSAPRTTCDPRSLAALELGLAHEKFGAEFRQRIYAHVTSGSLSDGLARVLTAACAKSIAATHPDQAVVRLHHLAMRKGEVAGEAQEALLDLTGQDRRLYRLLIDRVRDRLGREPHKTEAHLHLLSELLGHDRAPEPPPWPDLFLGWETVFSHPPAKFWRPLVTSWLNAVTDDPTQDMALGVMVAATHGRPAPLHRLYALTCDWAGTARHSARAAVAALFWQHIDHAQYARAESARHAGPGPRITEEER
ncbi:hypothetical protein [Streptomyces sp. NPDC058855]|uniref:hypothetical protein n=1 Tax=Streptomyces sp. NPDC058855 TaxID=3346651 RepID=UPI0036B5D965